MGRRNPAGHSLASCAQASWEGRLRHHLARGQLARGKGRQVPDEGHGASGESPPGLRPGLSQEREVHGRKAPWAVRVCSLMPHPRQQAALKAARGGHKPSSLLPPGLRSCGGPTQRTKAKEDPHPLKGLPRCEEPERNPGSSLGLLVSSQHRTRHTRGPLQVFCRRRAPYASVAAWAVGERRGPQGRGNTSRAVSPLMDREEAAALRERAIALSRAEAEAGRRDNEEREAQEMSAVTFLREVQGRAGAGDPSSAIPDGERAEYEEAIRQSLLAEEERKRTAELLGVRPGSTGGRVYRRLTLELDGEQVQVQEESGGLWSGSESQQAGEGGVRDEASRQGRPAGALDDGGRGSIQGKEGAGIQAWVRVKALGLRRQVPSSDSQHLGAGRWVLREGGAPKRGPAGEEAEGLGWSQPLRERVAQRCGKVPSSQVPPPDRAGRWWRP